MFFYMKTYLDIYIYNIYIYIILGFVEIGNGLLSTSMWFTSVKGFQALNKNTYLTLFHLEPDLIILNLIC